MPPNIEIVDFSLAKFNETASQALGFQVEVKKTYKLCDFKPAYGAIFKDYIKDFDFWGYTDIDVVFGDIRQFITDELLMQYDVITAKTQYLLGHFTLYRNSEVNTHLFKKSRDFELVFRSPNQLFSFDECNFLWFPLLDGKKLSSINCDVESMTHVVRDLEQKGLIRVYFKTIMIEQDQFNCHNQFLEFDDDLVWSEGKLYSLAKKQEFMYFHFHFLKKQSQFIVPEWEIVPESFKISKLGFTNV
jgi:hypothetical protein